MLADLPTDWASDPDHPWAAFYAEHGLPGGVRVSLGHYEDLRTWDIEHLLANQHPFDPLFAGETVEERMAAAREQNLTDGPQDYGVCDDPAQVLARWPQLAGDPRPLLVNCRQILRSDQPAAGGWRWHKWGPYIGTQNPKNEYLHDDVHIDAVYLFEILQLTESAADVTPVTP